MTTADRPPVSPLVNYPDSTLDRMIRSAWYRAARGWQEVRDRCSKHGSNGHDELCLALGADARSADHTWHTLMTEKQRRKDLTQ